MQVIWIQENSGTLPLRESCTNVLPVMEWHRGEGWQLADDLLYELHVCGLHWRSSSAFKIRVRVSREEAAAADSPLSSANHLPNFFGKHPFGFANDHVTASTDLIERALI